MPNTSAVQSTSDSVANSTGESHITSESVTAVTSAVTSEAVVVSGSQNESGRTQSDIASAVLRESAARLPGLGFPFPSNVASEAAPATTGDGLAVSGQVSVITSQHQSVVVSSAAITPIPVTTGWEQYSTSLLVSELTAIGWVPGLSITPFLNATSQAAVASAAALTSDVRSTADSKTASQGVSEGVKP